MLIKSLLSAIVSSSSQRCSLIVTATFRWPSHQFLVDCQRLQIQAPPRGDNLVRKSRSLTLSTRRWLPTWWVQAPYQASQKGSNLPLVLRSQIQNIFAGLKEILIEPEEIYRRTRVWTGAVSPIDYNSLAREIKTDDEHSAIMGSHSSNSFRETEVFAYMVNIPEERARKFKEQAPMQ